MRALKGRLAALERFTRSRLRLPCVWARHGQSAEDAKAAAGLSPNAANPVFRWREPQ